MFLLLITGGAGFICDDTCLEMNQAGHQLAALDDCSNNSPIALERICEQAGPKVHLD